MAALRSAALAALGDKAAQVDDEILSYICGTVESALDEGQDDDDVIDAIAPLLDDCLDLHGAEINELCRAILRGAKAAQAPASTEALAAQSALAMPLKLNDALAEEAKDITSGLREAMNVKVNFNSSMMRRGTNEVIDGESEDALVRRLKMEKRSVKVEKRALRSARVRAMRDDETMQALVREPVVLHWSGVRKGTSDIALRGVSMQLGALELLSDCTLTIAFGRRYGLIGRNGIGKSVRARGLRPSAAARLPPRVAAAPAAHGRRRLPARAPGRPRLADAAAPPAGQALRGHPRAPAGAAH